MVEPTALRYHPALVALHWLLAVLIGLSLVVGFLVLAPMANSAPAKLFVLRAHMVAGLVIFALMVVRLAVRLRTRRPAPVANGSPLLDGLARAMHYTLYAVVVLMASSGIALALQAGLPDIVFRGSGTPLPESFESFRPHAVHGFLAWLLVVLIGLHFAAAGFHQLVLRDRLLSRMGFARS